MKHSEKMLRAALPGTTGIRWPLMYCGRLEEARSYAERGHSGGAGVPMDLAASGQAAGSFCDKAGALDAVKHGLTLEPGDHEFLTLKKKRSKPEPPWNRWNTTGSTPMPTGPSSKGWTRTPTISSAPSPASPSIRRGWSAFAHLRPQAGAVHTQRTLHAVPIYGERPSCGSGVPDE